MGQPEQGHASPRRIVIAGHGLAAWMSAVVLARALDTERYRVTLVPGQPDDPASPFADGDATLPWREPCHPALELDETRVIVQTGSAFTWGIALSGWNGPDATWFHPFGSLGANLGPIPFPQMVMKLRMEGVHLRLADFSLAALAAQTSRFQRPSRDPREVLSSCDYGLHLNIQKLIELLRASAAGVMVSKGRLQSPDIGADGMIAALNTDAGERVPGDLFLDCTGPAARLIGQLSGDHWQDWADWLPCDRVMSASFLTLMAPEPFSHAQATGGGWTRHLPLHGQTQLNSVFQSACMTEAENERLLEQLADGNPLRNLNSQPVRFGRRQASWLGNCIALGSSAALIDPLAVTNLQQSRAGLNRLLQLLPGELPATCEAAEYNRRTAAQLDNARDFAILHYRLNNRPGEPFWDDCRSGALPDSLDYRVRLYRARGRVALYDEEPLDESSWISLLDEHGVAPRQYGAIADGLKTSVLEAHVRNVRRVMLDTVRNMPPHADYLYALHGKQPGRVPS